MSKPRKELSDKEVEAFWETYRPPNPELGKKWAAALNAGVAKQQKEDQEALAKAKNGPGR